MMITEYQISPTDKVKLIEYGSSDYDNVVSLRYEILRKPLNLQFTNEQLAAEKEFSQLGYYRNHKLIACLMLAPEEKGKIKMKQVAVTEDWQGKGIGADLVKTAELFAKENGFQLMYCHARDTAVPFYNKLGYKIIGEMFIQVTIPHYYMEKEL